MLTPGDIRAVVIFSDAPAELAAWYRETLELAPLVESPDFIGLRTAAGVSLFIQRTSEGHQPGMGGIRPHVTVSDCRAVHERLVAAGARTILPVTHTGGELVCAVQDPHGNPVGLLQPLPRR